MKQGPVTKKDATKLDACPVQYAALPLRATPNGREILLVTSRETGRWIIPKGWPMKNRNPASAAAQEALEEAGVIGRVQKNHCGEYQAFKRFDEHFVLCSVRVFLLEVTEELPRWKEMNQRKRAWFSQQRAAMLVDEPGLAALIEALPADAA